MAQGSGNNPPKNVQNPPRPPAGAPGQGTPWWSTPGAAPPGAQPASAPLPQGYPQQPTYPPPPGYAQQPSYPQQPAYPPQQGYPQQPAYPPPAPQPAAPQTPPQGEAFGFSAASGGEKFNTEYIATAMVRERRRGQYIILGVIAALMGGLLWWALRPAPPKPKEPGLVEEPARAGGARADSPKADVVAPAEAAKPAGVAKPEDAPKPDAAKAADATKPAATAKPAAKPADQPAALPEPLDY